MRLGTFYLASALLPLVVPAVALALPKADSSSWLCDAQILLLGSLSLGGVPYVVFAAVVICFARRAEPRTWHRVSMAAPVGYAAVLFGVFGGEAVWSAEPYGWRVALVVAGWGLALGYGYVVIVQVARVLLQRLGWVASEDR